MCGTLLEVTADRDAAGAGDPAASSGSDAEGQNVGLSLPCLSDDQSQPAIYSSLLKQAGEKVKLSGHK
ncbi:hypothetical protein [Microcoleus sp. FACHB-672]|uniref:hypothetical protein n=1 Tax=Microcoleus sp. FACHB-672 TaxID=2692825 RepID=UPI001688A349|nr:hypothetical protein [Microcoleus sp. FACHB-672]